MPCRTPPALLAGTLLTAALLSGCTGDDAPAGGQPAAAPSSAAAAPALPRPPEQDFSEGTCRAAAADVVALADTVQGLGQGPTVPAPVLAELTATQERLRAFLEGAEPAVRPALDQLIVSLGLARIRAVGNTYDSSLTQAVSTAYGEVLGACGAAPGQPGPGAGSSG